MKRVCIITGTRAEWGLMSRLARLIDADAQMQLQIVATNMHLMERYGMTYKEIENDGFTIDYRVPMEIADAQDTPGTTVRSMAKALEGFAGAYETMKPDLIVVLGDRYEILVAVEAALIFRIPVVHLYGGDVTEGAFDDSIRHSITKMSHLHFTSTEEYRQRVIQMGEAPDKVFNVGAIGVDNIKQIPLWSQEETENSLGGFTLDRNTILVTYHPVTLENNSAEEQIDQLLGALDELTHLRVLFTMPNSDTGSQVIAQRIQQWCASNTGQAVWFTSLGLKRYLSVLQYIGAVVGNSSSGIVEVPSFGIPTVNIGNRQKGRISARSVYHCEPKKSCIKEQILVSLQGSQKAKNPYEKSDTALNIYKKIQAFPFTDTIKHFYDL